MFEHICTIKFEPKAPTYFDRQAVVEKALKGASGYTRGVYHWCANAVTQSINHRKQVWITPRMKTIAASLGCDIRTVQRAFKELRARNLFDTEKRFRNITGDAGEQKRRRISSRLFVYRTTQASVLRKAWAQARSTTLAIGQRIGKAIPLPEPYSSDIFVAANTAPNNKHSSAPVRDTRTPEQKRHDNNLQWQHDIRHNPDVIAEVNRRLERR